MSTYFKNILYEKKSFLIRNVYYMEVLSKEISAFMKYIF